MSKLLSRKRLDAIEGRSPNGATSVHDGRWWRDAALDLLGHAEALKIASMAEALEEAAKIADRRALACRQSTQRYQAEQQLEMAATERCAGIEALHIARLIRTLAERLAAAQAIDTRSAETAGLSPKGESAVAVGEAPK